MSRLEIGCEGMNRYFDLRERLDGQILPIPGLKIFIKQLSNYNYITKSRISYIKHCLYHAVHSNVQFVVLLNDNAHQIT